MTNKPYDFFVHSHPSGRRTLEMMPGLEGATKSDAASLLTEDDPKYFQLSANMNPAQFYRAVALFFAELVSQNTSFTFTDSTFSEDE